LRRPALAQQHHLDALTLLGGYFPPQRCIQPPDLAFGAFDHLFSSESDDLSESHLASRRQFTATFGTRYPKHFDLISYGSGITIHKRCFVDLRRPAFSSFPTVSALKKPRPVFQPGRPRWGYLAPNQMQVSAHRGV
jgi:hypothetical protein